MPTNKTPAPLLTLSQMKDITGVGFIGTESDIVEVIEQENHIRMSVYRPESGLYQEFSNFDDCGWCCNETGVPGYGSLWSYYDSSAESMTVPEKIAYLAKCKRDMQQAINEVCFY